MGKFTGKGEINRNRALMGVMDLHFKGFVEQNIQGRNGVIVFVFQQVIIR